MRWFIALIALAAVLAMAGVNGYLGSLIVSPDWNVVYGAWCLLSGLIIGGVGAYWAWN